MFIYTTHGLLIKLKKSVPPSRKFRERERESVCVLYLTGVPLTLVDICVFETPFASDTGASLEIPKSETLAVHLESSSMLFALISR